MKFESIPAHLITRSGELTRQMCRNMCSVAHMIAMAGDWPLPPQLWGEGAVKSAVKAVLAARNGYELTVNTSRQEGQSPDNVSISNASEIVVGKLGGSSSSSGLVGRSQSWWVVAACSCQCLLSRECCNAAMLQCCLIDSKQAKCISIKR